MKFAVMSDTHDHMDNLQKAIEIIRAENCSAIIHCGDIIAPFMLKILEKAEMPVHIVFGNNDGDSFLLTRTALESGGSITLHGLWGRLELDGLKIAFVHDGPLAEGLAATGKYDMVFFGHSHQHYQDRIGETVLFNPGDVMGKDIEPGFGIVDSRTREISRVLIR